MSVNSDKLDELCIKSYQFHDAVANHPEKIVSAVDTAGWTNWHAVHSGLNLTSGWVQPDIKHLTTDQKKELVQDYLLQSSAMLTYRVWPVSDALNSVVESLTSEAEKVNGKRTLTKLDELYIKTFQFYEAVSSIDKIVSAAKTFRYWVGWLPGWQDVHFILKLSCVQPKIKHLTEDQKKKDVRAFLLESGYILCCKLEQTEPFDDVVDSILKSLASDAESFE